MISDTEESTKVSDTLQELELTQVSMAAAIQAAPAPQFQRGTPPRLVPFPLRLSALGIAPRKKKSKQEQYDYWGRLANKSKKTKAHRALSKASRKSNRG